MAADEEPIETVRAARAVFVESSPAVDEDGRAGVLLTFAARSDPTDVQVLALGMEAAGELVVSVLVDLKHLGDASAAEMLGRFLEED